MRICNWPRSLVFVLTLMVTAATTSPVLAEIHVVELNGIVFVPANITIRVGDTVRWVWVSGFHNVESGVIVDGNGVPDGNFRSGDPVLPPEEYDVLFDQSFLDAHPMTDDLYPYYCIVHAGVDMAGTVQVVGCAQDADCDEGLFCTGTETCVAGTCQAGTDPCPPEQFCDEETDSCRVRVGACCVGGGCLRDLEEGFCEDVLGGVYAGDFTDCDEGVCDPGACCFDGGSCRDLHPGECQDAGGLFAGDETDCARWTCTEACCREGGECEDIAPSVCHDGGGISGGLGSTCEESLCLGVCCINSECVPGQEEDDCIGAGGRWAGPFTDCDDDPDICRVCIRDPAWQCDGDVDGDGQVNPVDSGLVLAAFGSFDDQDLCNYDVDCDGQINPVDSGIVQSLFGTCEAPRGVCP